MVHAEFFITAERALLPHSMLNHALWVLATCPGIIDLSMGIPVLTANISEVLVTPHSEKLPVMTNLSF